jgi:endonuclease G
MKKIITLALLILSFSAFANPIDVSCKQLTYKSAPVVVNADQYVCHTQYALAYSWTTRNPIYTTEFLSKDHTGGEARTNDFRVDPAIDDRHQAKPKDYHKNTGCGGERCDQGHMTPDQDFSACAVCVSESFFQDNMVPQHFKNNEVIWKGMEVKIRGYAANHPAGVYVITGPAYNSQTTPTATIGDGNIWVPDNLFKIMIDASTGKSIAFYMPNSEQKDLSKFVVSISVIEAATGIKFDSSLDKKSVADFNEFVAQSKK